MRREALPVEFKRRPLSSLHLRLKYKLSFLIFTLYFLLFFRFIREDSKYVAWKGYLSTCSAMTLNSRRHDVTSIEHNVDQSGRLFIRDVARLRFSRGQMSLSAIEDSFLIRVY